MIREADGETLAKYAENVQRYVAKAMTSYANNPASNAFKIPVDDRAIDE
ncbi:MAG: hypothetical protein H0W40_09000 [Methylibium sp.]|nr:hypothetical protein [Methylibium sp.]MBA3597503.1 hypothetical protein [Methylibium sp.]